MPKTISPGLSRRRILETALALTDAEGLDALGMRRIAAELGVTAMALYNHVESRKDVAQGVVDLLSEELRLPGARGAWDRRLARCFRSVRDVCLAHPKVVPLVQQVGPSRAVFAPMECALAALDDAGLPFRHALNAYCTLIGFTLGQVTYQIAGTQQRLHAAPDLSGFPRVARARGAAWDFDAAFQFGLEVIIEGLRRRAARNS